MQAGKLVDALCRFQHANRFFRVAGFLQDLVGPCRHGLRLITQCQPDLIHLGAVREVFFQKQ